MFTKDLVRKEAKLQLWRHNEGTNSAGDTLCRFIVRHDDGPYMALISFLREPEKWSGCDQAVTREEQAITDRWNDDIGEIWDAEPIETFDPQARLKEFQDKIQKGFDLAKGR